MLQHERHRRIVAIAEADGRVTVLEAAATLGVAAETIRRDLSALQHEGLIRRVHGGAVPIDQQRYEPLVHKREHVRVEEKTRIARAALDELPESGVLIIDAGSTPRRFAEVLPVDRRFTVVTNSLPVAAALVEKPNLDVIITGGTVKRDTLAVVDFESVASIVERLADIAFLGCDGMTSGRGLTTHARDEARVKEAMIRSSRRAVLLADHSKYGNEQFATFAKLEEIDTIISDTGLSDDAVADLESGGTLVVRA